MTDRMCCNCAFVAALLSGYFECRIRAPVVLQYADGPWTRWPMVEADDWCGEFRHRQNDSDPGAAHEPEAAHHGWQPIATAPTDGTVIAVYAPPYEPNAPDGGLPALLCFASYHPDGGWCIDELRYPTHWMPLPVSGWSVREIMEHRQRMSKEVESLAKQLSTKEPPS